MRGHTESGTLLIYLPVPLRFVYVSDSRHKRIW